MPASTRAPIPSSLKLLGGAIGLLIVAAALSAIGGPQSPMTGLAVVLELAIRAGLPVAAYLLGGIGLGEIVRPLLRGSRSAGPVSAAVGLGLMLSLSHALGCFGLLAGRVGTVIAILPCVAGLALLARRTAIVGRDRRSIQIPAMAAAAIPAVALLLVAACNPPGWLWDSEAGGYDALEYHLQLPQEWIRLGRITPLEHNVYSFLPGYVESAFVHLAALTAAPAVPPPGSHAWGLLAGDGARAISCQFLSSGLAIFAAIETAWLVLAIGRRLAPDLVNEAPRAWMAGATAAAALLLCTPWIVVTGSLAYNDLGVLVFLAAAMIAALDGTTGPLVRGGLLGALVGFACGCKPTALFMAGLPAGLMLLAITPPRKWTVAIASGAAAGLLVTSPWLIRNWLACGNPVFPFGASVFGAAHWTGEQIERYRAAHLFQGTLLQRLQLLFLIDPTDPVGARFRGLTHPQWFALVPAAVAAAIVGLCDRRLRRAAGLLILCLGAQLVAWLFMTHLQSRFLLPLAIPACAIVGVAAALAARAGRIRGLTLLAPLVCLVQVGAAVVIFAEQRAGEPNALLLAGPAIRSGDALPPDQRPLALAQASPELLANLAPPVDGKVYLLGDATPFYYTADVLYNTTFDRWPLGDAIRAAHADPAAWTESLRRLGVRLVVVNFGELARLAKSGWSDPAVTPDAVESWLKSGPRAVRNWPEQGWLLVELPPETPR